MTDLYIRAGTAPQPLPFSAFDTGKRLWTDLANNEEGRAATGWDRPAPPRPDDTETQTSEWDADAEAWVMVDRPPDPTPTAEDLAALVDAERDRRIDAGFVFSGNRYQSRPKDRENILGATSLAHMALTIGGKTPTDSQWHGGAEPFVWIADDNSLVPMDAQTVIAFGQAAADHKAAHTFAARALKEAESGVPSDYADDRHWPSQAVP